MEILRIIFAVMIVISLLAMVLLFIDGGKYGKNTMIFNSIAMWSIFISWIDFTSIPVNYSTQPFSYQLKLAISLFFGAMSIIAAFVFFIKRVRPNHARTIMALAIAGGMMGLLL